MSAKPAALPGLAGDHPLVLAPLEEITDGPFRRLARRFGADLVYTEFVSAEAIVHGAVKAERKLAFSEAERPIAIQIVGSRVEALVEAARAAAAGAPDLLDLNFGCPARKVAGKGAGAGLLRTPELLEEITREVVRASPCPVTAKVRLGWDGASINVIEIAQRIERAGARAIAIHARTRSQGFAGRADWTWIARVKREVSIPVIGNGDVASPEDAARMFAETGCDAVMIGRAAMGNPWIFRASRAYLATGEHAALPGARERVAVLLDHLRDAAQAKGEPRAVIEMRKHYRGYLRGLPGAARLRAALMTPVTCAGVAALLADYLATEARPDADPPDLT
jgi:tRNA-dihydrouridine synthase B